MSSEVAAADRLQITPVARQLITDLQARARADLISSLPSGEPRNYLYDLLPSYPERSGKGLRPLLCLAACQAHGGSVDAAMPFAVAIELMHNAFLVHDDIQDGSLHRRGRLSLHVEHGVPLALNTGDALAALANSTFVRATRQLRGEAAGVVLDRWERTMSETLEGQALDLGWQRDNVVDIDVADYLTMAGKKTAWYTTVLPLALGTLVATGRPESADATFGFGWALGLLFQVANDLAGLEQPGESCRQGAGDIEEGKRTILMIHLLGELEGAEHAELVRIMGLPRGSRGPDEVAWVLERMAEHGSVEYAQTCLYGFAGAALQQADEAFDELPESPAREALFAVTPYVLEADGYLAAIGGPFVNDGRV
jgi:geranylgeranyl diphosphate synthase type II